MRRLLRILLTTLKWTTLSLSTLLLAATVFMWVRSVGYEEIWIRGRFEPRPDWSALELAEQGIRRTCYVQAIEGRLWLGSLTSALNPKFQSGAGYRRTPVPQDWGEKIFDFAFQPGERPLPGSTERVWRFAGAGFRHWSKAVDPQIGRPKEEALTLALPFWMLTVIFALWPLGFVAVRLLRKKRRAANQCPQCGYDLRSTPDPAGPLLPRCLECGAADSASRAAQLGRIDSRRSTGASIAPSTPPTQRV